MRISFFLLLLSVGCAPQDAPQFKPQGAPVLVRDCKKEIEIISGLEIKIRELEDECNPAKYNFKNCPEYVLERWEYGFEIQHTYFED